METVASAVTKSQMNARPKCESRNDQPAMSQENKMMTSAHSAPTQGFNDDSRHADQNGGAETFKRLIHGETGLTGSAC